MSDPDQTGPDEDQILAALELRLQQGLERMRTKDVDGAADIFRGILRQEPRLAEPRMELARICLDTGQLAEAEEHAREGLRVLQHGGQWLDNLTEAQMQSLAQGLLGEILRRQGDSDEVVFGDPGRWKALMDEARQCFQEAARLDPENAHAAWWGFGLRVGDEDAAEGAEE